MSENNVDVLFVYIVYIKTKMCMKSRKRKKKKQSISGYGLYNETKKKTLFHYKSTLF